MSSIKAKLKKLQRCLCCGEDCSIVNKVVPTCILKRIKFSKRIICVWTIFELLHTFPYFVPILKFPIFSRWLLHLFIIGILLGFRLLISVIGFMAAWKRKNNLSRFYFRAMTFQLLMLAFLMFNYGRPRCHCEGSLNGKEVTDYYQCRGLQDLGFYGQISTFVNFIPAPDWHPAKLTDPEQRAKINKEALELKGVLDPKLIDKLKELRYQHRFFHGFHSFRVGQTVLDAKKTSDKKLSQYQLEQIEELFDMFDQVKKNKNRDPTESDGSGVAGDLKYTKERYDGLVPIDQLEIGLNFLEFDVKSRVPLKRFNGPIKPYLSEDIPRLFPEKEMGLEEFVDLDEFADWMACAIFHCAKPERRICSKTDDLRRPYKETHLQPLYPAGTGLRMDSLKVPFEFAGKYAIVEKPLGEKPRCEYYRIIICDDPKCDSRGNTRNAILRNKEVDPKKPLKKYWLNKNQVKEAAKRYKDCLGKTCVDKMKKRTSLVQTRSTVIPSTGDASLSTAMLSTGEVAMGPFIRRGQEIPAKPAGLVGSCKTAGDSCKTSLFEHLMASLVETDEENFTENVTSISTTPKPSAQKVKSAKGVKKLEREEDMSEPRSPFKDLQGPLPPARIAPKEMRQQRQDLGATERKLLAESKVKELEYTVGKTHAKCLHEHCQPLYVNCKNEANLWADLCDEDTKQRLRPDYGSKCGNWDGGQDWCFVKKSSWCHQTLGEKDSSGWKRYTNDMSEPLVMSKVRCAYVSPRQSLRRRATEDVCRTFKRIVAGYTFPVFLMTLYMVIVVHKFIQNGCSDRLTNQDAEFQQDDSIEDFIDDMYEDEDGFSDDDEEAFEERKKSTKKKLQEKLAKKQKHESNSDSSESTSKEKASTKDDKKTKKRKQKEKDSDDEDFNLADYLDEEDDEEEDKKKSKKKEKDKPGKSKGQPKQGKQK